MINISINTILEWIFSILLALLFYKNAMKKKHHIFSFYKSMSEYRFFKEGLALRVISSLLITCDFVIALVILIPIYRPAISLLGIAIQLFYFFIMIINYNLYSDNNCGCFIINTPYSVSFKDITINLSIMFVFMSVFVLTIK